MSNHVYVAETSAESSYAVLAPELPLKQAPVKREASLSSAVYGHIRAMRSLGHTSVKTDQIAKALDLPLEAVDRAVRSMQNKGVKITSK